MLGSTFLKKIGDSIALPLAEIFAKRMEEGVVPLINGLQTLHPYTRTGQGRFRVITDL